MSEVTPPTCEQIWDEKFERVHREVDASWRHGCYIHDIYHRGSDDTYWAADYRLSTDGETNELREGHADIYRVMPISQTITAYVPYKAD